MVRIKALRSDGKPYVPGEGFGPDPVTGKYHFDDPNDPNDPKSKKLAKIFAGEEPLPTF